MLSLALVTPPSLSLSPPPPTHTHAHTRKAFDVDIYVKQRTQKKLRFCAVSQASQPRCKNRQSPKSAKMDSGFTGIFREFSDCLWALRTVYKIHFSCIATQKMLENGMDLIFSGCTQKRIV